MLRSFLSRIIRRWAEYLSVGCVLVVVLSVLAASCTENERHKILSSFFDGVPPLGEDAAKSAGVVKETSNRSNAVTEAFVYVHEPQRQRQCVRCHGEEKQENFSREVQLTAPVPKLCYGCHQEIETLKGWIHGPVAAGECLLCHEPHRSNNRHLMKLPIPDICFQCHNPENVRLIPNHEQEHYVKCDGCHSGHTSESRYLLNRKRMEMPETTTQVPQKVVTQKPEVKTLDELVIKARDKIANGSSLMEMLREVYEYVNKSRLDEAKIYLKVIMQSSAYTDVQKRNIAGILLRMEESSQTDEDEIRELVLTGEMEALKEVLVAEKPEKSQVDSQYPVQMSETQIAELYYNSLKDYRAGRLIQARNGFNKVLYNDTTPEQIKQAIQKYLSEIEGMLNK